jgi:hypothetical protein
VVLALNGSPIGTINTTQQSSQCAPGTTPGSQQCTATFAIDAGTYAYALTAFDQTNGSGNKLSTASGQFVVVPNQANTLHAILDGIVHTLGVALNPSVVQQGTPATVTATVSARDADGNVIISGAYLDANGNPVAITLTGSDNTGNLAVGHPTITSTAPSVPIAYSGGRIPTQTVFASAPGVMGGGATLVVNTPSALPTGSARALAMLATPLDATNPSGAWTVAAAVIGTDGRPMANAAVTFGTSGGTLTQTTVTTDGTGVATTTIVPPVGGASIPVVAVQSAAGGRNAAVNIVFGATSTSSARRRASSTAGPPVVFGTSLGQGLSSYSNPLFGPHVCHFPEVATTAPCQSVLSGEGVATTTSLSANFTCAQGKKIIQAVEAAACVGVASTIGRCLAASNVGDELGPAGYGALAVICNVEMLSDNPLAKGCFALIVELLAEAAGQEMVADNVLMQQDSSLTDAFLSYCDERTEAINQTPKTLSFSLGATTFSTAAVNYQPTLPASGTNFNALRSITFTQIGVAGGPYTWSHDDGTWDNAVALGKLVQNQDTAMILRPVVTKTGDAPGVSHWTVSVTDGKTTQSAQFTVDYEPGTGSTPATPANTTPGSTGSPGPTLSSTTVTVSWSPSANATIYKPTFTDVIANQVVVAQSTTSAVFTTSLSPGRQYAWSVQACNGATCSASSTLLYFQTPAAIAIPSVPTNLAPGTASGPGPTQFNNTVVLSWNSSPGATYYEVIVHDVAANLPVVDATPTVPSYLASLNNDRQYNWSVRACNSSGCSPYTTLLYFQTPPGATIPAAPSNASPGSSTPPGPTQSSRTVTLSWGSLFNAAFYKVFVLNATTNSLVVNGQIVTTTSYAPTFTAAGKFEWYVQACNAIGCSPSSTPLYFQTP